MTFKVIDYHPEHSTWILQDEGGDVWWREEEKTKSGVLRYFTNYPDEFKALMKSNTLNAHSMRAMLNSEAETAIKNWEIKNKYKEAGLSDEQAETAVKI